MKILIADDEKYVRYGLKSMLKELYSYTDIKEAVNGEEIIELPKEDLQKTYSATEQEVIEQARRIDKKGLPGTKIAKDAIALKKEYFK